MLRIKPLAIGCLLACSFRADKRLAASPEFPDQDAGRTVRKLSYVTLEELCKTMLARQKMIHQGLAALASAHPAADRKLSPEVAQEARKLAARQKQVVDLLTDAVDFTREEGSAIALAKIMEQVRKDAKTVENRLHTGDVSNTTRTIEEDIFETLQDMVSALRKR